MEVQSLKVTVSKSHILTIGERLYSESVELVRELVNNAYDADATRVQVAIQPDVVEVADDGHGMDLEELRSYFNIGSQEKLKLGKSRRFHRPLIGQFGIGKFASLTAAKSFSVYTQKQDFAARAVFDKERWQAQESEGSWEIPLEILNPDPARGDGTTVALHRLTKQFALEQVEKRVRESVPINDANFQVILNGKVLSPKRFQGQKIPILEGSPYGIVNGEIVILPASAADPKEIGIDIKVKNVTIRRELFGMETWGKDVVRVRGEIHADFLPVTSDRSGFVMDSEQYQTFSQLMKGVMGNVRQLLSYASRQSRTRKASRVLRDALERIYRAIARNPQLSPFGPLPMGEAGGREAGRVSEKKSRTERVIELSPEGKPDEAEKTSLSKRPRVHRLTPNAIVRKIKWESMNVSCCVDSFGRDGPEVFTEAGIIYINQDHPLYSKQQHKASTFILHITRLIAQEMALMKRPRDPREAFDLQSQILAAALVEEE